MRPPLSPRLLHSWLWSLASLLSLSSLAVESPQWDGQESIEQYARRASVEPTRTLDLGNGVKLEMVLIPAGKFVMGTEEPEARWIGAAILLAGGLAVLVLLAVPITRAIRQRRRPQFSLRWLILLVAVVGVAQYGGVRWWRAAETWRGFHYNDCFAHEVTLSAPLYVGRYDVTQEQYQQVIGENPSRFKGQNLPVEQVTWHEAQEFCKKISETTRQPVRLPTEAEWEFACRAGTTTRFSFGDADADLESAAWYAANSGGTTHPVGQKKPNAWGLYDMHGNVEQWCGDWYAKSFRPEAATDPQGPADRTDNGGRWRVHRGGAWINHPQWCRSSYRWGHPPDYRSHSLGFRVAADVPPKAR